MQIFFFFVSLAAVLSLPIGAQYLMSRYIGRWALVALTTAYVGFALYELWLIAIKPDVAATIADACNAQFCAMGINPSHTIAAGIAISLAVLYVVSSRVIDRRHRRS